MKLSKTLLWITNVVILIPLMLLMFGGFLLTMLGLHGIMLFFWLGEHTGILRQGVYNDKHDALLQMLPYFRDVIQLRNIARPPKRNVK